MTGNSSNAAKLIFFVGMPAVGKTYGGHKMALRHNLTFIDLDTLIEQAEGMKVAEIFGQYGESRFRELEHKYLTDIIRTVTTNTIIACGGGTPCFHNNMQLMKDAGTVIYLQSDIAHLLDNLIGTDAARPLLNNLDDLSAYLATTLAQRKDVYEQADHILPIKDISLATFDQIILSCINKL